MPISSTSDRTTTAREWLSPKAAAELAEVDVSTVRRWDDRGFLPNTRRKVTGYRRISRADVLAAVGAAQ